MKSRILTGQHVSHTDAQSYQDCIFVDAVLSFMGGKSINFVGCTFVGKTIITAATIGLYGCMGETVETRARKLIDIGGAFDTLAACSVYDSHITLSGSDIARLVTTRWANVTHGYHIPVYNDHVLLNSFSEAY